MTLSTGALAKGAPAVPSGAELLRRVLANDQRVPYEGRQTVMLSSGAGTRGTIARELHRGPGHTRVEYLFPKSAAGRLVVTDGAHRWEYNPATHTAIRSDLLRKPSSAQEGGRIIGRLLHTYRVHVEPKPAFVLGRPAYVLHIDPATADRHRRVWWVDKATSVVLRREVYDIDGQLDSATYFTSIDFHPHAGPANFAFSPPAGTRVITKASRQAVTSLAAARRLAPGWGRVPARLPQGFEFASAELVRVKGTRSLHLEYTDGLVTLSLIEVPGKATLPRASRRTKSVQVGRTRGTLVQKAPYRVLSWQSDGNTLNLVADLAEKTLLAIAARL